MDADRQIVGLDLIRFFAAALVVAFHFGYWIWADPLSATAQAAMGAVRFDELAFCRVGFVGVDIFFVISGFIIAWSAANSNAPRFFKGRLVRLVPAILIIAPITLIAAIVVDLAPAPELALRLVRTMTLWPFGPWIDGVYWTLPIEVAFYATIFALLLMRRFDLVVLVATVIGLVSTAFWFAVRWQVPIVMSALAEHERPLQLLLIYHGCFFAMGLYLWLILLNRLKVMLALVCAPILIGCLLSIWMERHSYAECAIWTAAVVAIWPAVHFNKLLHRSDRLARIARYLGLMTYPLYLIHDVVGAAMIGWLARSGIDRYAALATATVMVLLSAAAIALWLEPRLQRWLRVILAPLDRSIASPQSA